MFLRLVFLSSVLSMHSLSASADDPTGPVVVSIQKGESAPFDGTLFNTRAAADILVQLENQDAACQINIDRAVALREAELNLDIERAEISKNACEEKYEAHINLKREEINFLYDRLKKQSNSKDAIWFGVGTATGVGITALSVWILKSVTTSAN